MGPLPGSNPNLLLSICCPARVSRVYADRRRRRRRTVTVLKRLLTIPLPPRSRFLPRAHHLAEGFKNDGGFMRASTFLRGPFPPPRPLQRSNTRGLCRLVGEPTPRRFRRCTPRRMDGGKTVPIIRPSTGRQKTFLKPFPYAHLYIFDKNNNFERRISEFV